MSVPPPATRASGSHVLAYGEPSSRSERTYGVRAEAAGASILSRRPFGSAIVALGKSGLPTARPAAPGIAG